MFGLDIAADEITAACSRPTGTRMSFCRAHVMRRNHAKTAKPMSAWDSTAACPIVFLRLPEDFLSATGLVGGFNFKKSNDETFSDVCTGTVVRLDGGGVSV